MDRASDHRFFRFNYYTLVSDNLISSGPNSGQYKSTFKYNIKDESGKDNPSFKDIMNKYYEMFHGRNHTNKTDFFNRIEDSDADT
jgi:hypothetical protein